MGFTATELAAWVGGTVLGDGRRTFVDGASLGTASRSQLVFVAGEKHWIPLQQSAAGVAIVPPSLRDRIGAAETVERTFVVADDPQDAFLAAVDRLRGRRTRPHIGISPYAHVADSATIGRGTNVHPGAHVGHGAVIGENCDVLPGAYVGPRCRLGDEVVLHPYAVLYEGVELGHRVIVHATAVVGADGFGYRFRNGRHEKVPHYGTVRIENDVEIGASSTVDRAMIGATVVGEGTKLDNLVMVAHNCQVGRHNVYVAQSGLAGSVTSGDYVVCAGHVGIADHVHLGEGCTIGAKAGLNKDVPPGETYIGLPAQPVQEAMKAAMSARKLPEMRQQLRDLRRQMAALEARLAEIPEPRANAA